jgi:hypothetical protein
MSTFRFTGVNPFFQTELSNALFKLSGASISLDGTTATVTLAAHLLTTGDYVTFSGTTGVTGLNNATWGPVTVTNSGVYTFPCTLTGSPAGTIVQEKLYFPPPGQYFCTLGANGDLEYNPASTLLTSGLSGGKTSLGTDTTWRKVIAASAQGFFVSDGQLVTGSTTAYLGSVRFRENGTSATSYFSRVN